MTSTGGTGGNISELGGYYNKLVYFCNCAKNNLPIEQAELSSAADSLKFLMKELSFGA